MFKKIGKSGSGDVLNFWLLENHTYMFSEEARVLPACALETDSKMGHRRLPFQGSATLSFFANGHILIWITTLFRGTLGAAENVLDKSRRPTQFLSACRPDILYCSLATSCFIFQSIIRNAPEGLNASVITKSEV